MSIVDSWRRLPPSAIAVLTLVAATLGGAVFAFFDLPAAWLAGALVAVSALALFGLPVYLPDLLRRIVFVVLGISLGATVVNSWTWVLYVFAAFLIWTGWKMARSNGHGVDPEKNPVLRLMRLTTLVR